MKFKTIKKQKFKTFIFDEPLEKNQKRNLASLKTVFGLDFEGFNGDYGK